ncbi:MAG: SDR family NAD(P)-dependent oxidoreductase, partial [Candidatus Binatia bacterium]
MSEQRRLEGKVAVVTGAGSGICRAIAVRLAAEGAKILATDVNAAGLEETVGVIRRAGGEASARPADVTKAKEIESVVRDSSRYGGLDVVVAGAGIGRFVRFEDLTEEEWNRTIAVNLTGVFLTCKAAIPLLLERGRGSIVTIASQSALGGYAYSQAYGASKAGVAMFTRCLAKEYASRGIRANAICPGGVLTPLLRGFQTEGLDTALIPQKGPIGRMSQPEEIAPLVAFLASDESGYITGQAIA